MESNIPPQEMRRVGGAPLEEPVESISNRLRIKNDNKNCSYLLTTTRVMAYFSQNFLAMVQVTFFASNPDLKVITCVVTAVIGISLFLCSGRKCDSMFFTQVIGLGGFYAVNFFLSSPQFALNRTIIATIFSNLGYLLTERCAHLLPTDWVPQLVQKSFEDIDSKKIMNSGGILIASESLLNLASF